VRLARSLAIGFLLSGTLARTTLADEGQWTPDQLDEIDFDELKSRGLELSPDQLWDPSGGGLLRAAVQLSGCSAAFVSARGLIATNHHCAYGALQDQSSVEHDYLRDGFYAATPGDELEAEGRTVRVLRSITDVTARVHEAIADAEDDANRARAAELAENQIVKECEQKSPGLRCRVASFYRGTIYRLFETTELRDVRIVYAPPSAIGNYGGEIDNWMWPRHTGDFALLRAYVGPAGEPAEFSSENVPYEPEHFLAVSSEGVLPGDFVAVLGYPGRTHRHLTTAETKRRLEQDLPAKAEVYGAWIEFLEDQARGNPELGIKLAAKLRSLANRRKNARGMIAGIQRMNLLERKHATDDALRKWTREHGSARHENVLRDLVALADKRRESFERDFLLENMSYGPGSLAIAIDLVRRARAQERPDIERPSDYMDRNERPLWRALEDRIRDFDAAVDAGLLEDLLGRVAKLPDDQRFVRTPPGRAASLVGRSRMSDRDHVRTLFDAADPVALAASTDPLVALAHELVDAIEDKEDRARLRTGEALVLGPAYFEMLGAVREGPLYPDANGTLRMSYAEILGYAPRDGLLATPQTTLAGALAKHTGVEPFRVPEIVRTHAAAARGTYWADPTLGDVPVCFLANADTTGGNSGSAMINGKGELVGLNFDRVWETIAGDFGYDVAVSRNISVDIRYLLWLLDDVVGADAVLEELGMSEYRDRTVRASPGAVGSVRAATLRDLRPPAPPDPGCGCRFERNTPVFAWFWPAVFVLARGRRRSGRG
jgi:hypothetical protein